jgi:hypothetical protein
MCLKDKNGPEGFDKFFQVPSSQFHVRDTGIHRSVAARLQSAVPERMCAGGCERAN